MRSIRYNRFEEAREMLRECRLCTREWRFALGLGLENAFIQQDDPDRIAATR